MSSSVMNPRCKMSEWMKKWMKILMEEKKADRRCCYSFPCLLPFAFAYHKCLWCSVRRCSVVQINNGDDFTRDAHKTLPLQQILYCMYKMHKIHSYSSAHTVDIACIVIITFCVSRRRRKMYSGHPRLCVCVSVCVSVCPRPYAHTTARTRM